MPEPSAAASFAPAAAAADPGAAAGTQDCEVFVIGGGPAGSSIATLLARQGRQVVLVDKDHHPRFHIGESLLPATVKLFEALGVRDQVERIGITKWGIEFISPHHDEPRRFEFADGWDPALASAWQVRRSELDELLFRHAAASGARTLEGCRVRKVDFDAGGATISADSEQGPRRWRAKFVVDASGRDTHLAGALGSKARNPKHNSAALFGHFRGAQRLQGRLEGHISIFWFQHGWFWFIPLADGTTSVGAVCWPYYLKRRDKSLREFFDDTIALAPRLADRLRGAELVDNKVYATGNYSYAGTVSQGERFILIGDAYAFVDPVFSSGLHLAVSSAFEGANLVQSFFDKPAALPAARRRFDQVLQHGPREFSWFIFRMTTPMMRELFMHPRNPLGVQSAVLSLLAGDIYRQRPFLGSLWLFKLIYWVSSGFNLPRTVRAWRQHRRDIAEVGAVPGENIMPEQR